MPRTKYVIDWLTRAQEDIQAAEILLRENDLMNQVCFHCQQAAEKYLKGFLAFHETNVRKIHELEILLAECQKLDGSLSQLKEEAVYLNQFYVETRYPGDIPEFSRQDAQKALEAALRIKELILPKIN